MIDEIEKMLQHELNQLQLKGSKSTDNIRKENLNARAA